MTDSILPRLNVIVGSTRPGRSGPVVADWVVSFCRQDGRFEVELTDLDAFALPLLDEAAHPRLQKYEHLHTREWSAAVASADAYVFVTPEYDFFPPAALVNAIQCLHQEWRYKPAGIVSYGGAGGLRSGQMLKQLLNNLGMMPIPQSVPLHKFSQRLSETAFNPEESEIRAAQLMIDELHKWTEALTRLRRNGS